MKRLALDVTYLLLFCALWYSAIRVWYWYRLVHFLFIKLRKPIFSAKDGPNVLFQSVPNLESVEGALADLPKDVKFLVFQLTGCGVLFYAIFYFSSFIATGRRISFFGLRFFSFSYLGKIKVCHFRLSMPSIVT